MSKHIQAYFETESQAEGAKTSLLSFEIEHLETGALENTLTSNNNLLGPVISANNLGTTIVGGAVLGSGAYGASGFTGTNGPQAVLPLAALNDEASNHNDTGYVDTGRDEHQRDRREDTQVSSKSNVDDLKYVLSATVKETEVDSVINKLRSQGAYVELLD
ncbi:hypothetical protein [Paenibacillus sp. YPG26]|uniref:hypothetical protein n=1 Tax=Paenibacillus sp. YPG26 TaxID=2878915 RepID=UPI0020404AA4|nr:hypothetical protein [Paenibacillus sp. YPG26]USB34293.1 hypothetical protein LDO05_05805 [Paenibacillus sp. YPG26]